MISDSLQKFNKLTNAIKILQNQSNPQNSYQILPSFVKNKSYSKNQQTKTKTKSQNIKLHTTKNYNNTLKKYQNLLKRLFQQRCKGLQISYNQDGWKSFLKLIYTKNQNYFENQEASQNQNNNGQQHQYLDFSQLTLTKNCSKILSQLISPNITALNLSKNHLNFQKICLINIKNLTLVNCGLHNESLQLLFQILIKQNKIQSLNISSNELNQRNILTRYQKLYQLLLLCKNLTILQMGNMSIKSQNQIFYHCKKSSLKHLNLSKNNGVVGAAPNLLSLNLSHNNISVVNKLVVADCRLKQLNISQNPIPYYKFSQFLKYQNLSSLSSLNLNSITINGECQALQIFLSQTRELKLLKLVDCSLSKQSWGNIVYGLRSNSSITDIDLSKNQISNLSLAKQLGVSLFNANLIRLKMVLCNLSDEFGESLFSQLKNNKTIQSIIISQNKLSHKTGGILASILKTNFTICSLQFGQNFINYLKQQELNSYIERNKYFYAQTIKKQYNELKGINQIYTSKLIDLQKVDFGIKETKKQKNNLQIQYYKLKHSILQKQKQDITKNIKNLLQIQKLMNKKMDEILQSQGSILSNSKQLMVNSSSSFK